MRRAVRMWAAAVGVGVAVLSGTPAAALTPAAYEEFVTVTDDTDAISVTVPADWDDVDGAPYTGADGIAYKDVRAAPDLTEFLETWDTPGVIVTASSALAQSSDEGRWLDELAPALDEACDRHPREPYADGAYTGLFDLYTACGGTSSAYLVVAAAPADRTFLVRVQVQAVEERDIEALAEILASFQVIGAV